MSYQKGLPQTLQEAIKYFSDERQCIDFVTDMRWPDGVKCAHCGHDRVGWLSNQKRWKCKNKECRKQFSVKTGTIMEDSPLKLEKWLAAIWMIVNCKNGISSYEIHRELGVTQKTGWFLLQRIRLAMQHGSLEKFSDEVEVDETYVGQKARNMHASKKAEKIKGTGTSGKTIVMGALQRGPKGESKVKAKVIKATDRQTLKTEVEADVEKGSTLYTDGHSGYDLLDAEYVRLVIDHAVKYVDGKISTNGIENFWTLLKRCLKGTYVSVEPFHLHRYLDEQAYRFNNRKDSNLKRFVGVVGGIEGKRITYQQLTGEID